MVFVLKRTPVWSVPNAVAGSGLGSSNTLTRGVEPIDPQEGEVRWDNKEAKIAAASSAASVGSTTDGT
jgi:hypothetical protein